MEASSNQPDLISGLSDLILIHILSFLPSNLSGRTCILSQRWRHLWEQVPELIFHDFSSAQLFSFMMHRKSSKLRRFHVTANWINFSWRFPIDQALGFCSTQGVEELHLLFGGLYTPICSRYLLRAKTLSCWESSLRVLNLESCHVSCPIKINLPKVVELCLSSVSMARGAFDHIITGCPSVEIFEIGQCEVSFLRFHLPILKRFVLNQCNNLEHIDISVPNLKFFKHEGRVESLKTFVMRVENLEEAEFTIYDEWDCNQDRLVWGLRHLFQAVAQAEHLKVVCGGTQDTLFRIFNMNLRYKNVKCLVLKNADSAFLMVVPAIIRLLPGLENLDLSLPINPFCSPQVARKHYRMYFHMSELEKEFYKHLKDPMRSIDCLSYSLRRIDVRGFEAKNVQIELLKFLVHNASVLNVICFTDSYGSIARLLKYGKILMSCAINKNTKFLGLNSSNRN
ncbi:hypothetical protein LUZ63_006922 [Rhynchospora breviuscula]|uniref:F-box/LRR-repeat protein 15/At3g58940/PEG3-like LRR domain-containing protein n=1 Tax=Rhynchospora breviuscula TaxID=2022672 RepID=A0A9Q0CQR7_9POAL|nr:hypothetical protein LUZ63_006922 [Rhynchospora breviuscula]